MRAAQIVLSPPVGHARCMQFVGLDLAWVSKNRSGYAVVDGIGRLQDIGIALSNDDIEAKLFPYLVGDCVVGIDAPLRVTNEAGSRVAEKQLFQDFGAFQAGARPAYRLQPLGLFNPPRGEVLARKLGLDIDPHSRQARRAIEVYPHPATVSLFGLSRTLKYKRGLGSSPRERLSHRKAELLRLINLIEGLDGASLPLQVKGHGGWQQVRRDVECASRPVELDLAEDPVDAVLCAYVAMVFAYRRDQITIYGDFPENGYIATPTLPPHLVPDRAKRAHDDPPWSESACGVASLATPSSPMAGDDVSDEIDRCRSLLYAFHETWSMVEDKLHAGLIANDTTAIHTSSFSRIADRLREANQESSTLVDRLKS